MIQTSDKYKEAVYTREYARYFMATILFKLIDVSARQGTTYTFNSPTFYTYVEQLFDDVLRSDFKYGTLEDYQFLLNGTKKIMPDHSLRVGQYGISSEWMTDENGVFETPIELDCYYDEPINTSGRTFYFDANLDSVPSDFDVYYYSKGDLVNHTVIRDNTELVWSAIIQTTLYDHIRFIFRSMTKPYRRLHIIEDIPGLHLAYDATHIVSINYSQEIDIFSKQIVSGEVDFQIENAEKLIDILNPEGFAKYLQQRQPIDIEFQQVFRDDSTEAVPLNTMYLSDWKINKGALLASFTARDKLDDLTLDEYIKGQFPVGAISLYECAEAVLIDAGVTDYYIDVRLMNIYTTAPLPIGTHKEVMRHITQAGQSVLVSDVSGQLQVRYISPLVGATNQYLNASFGMDFTNWAQSGCTLDNTQLYLGKQSVKMAGVSSLAQTIPGAIGHKVYVRFYMNPVDAALVGTSAGLYVNDVLITPNMVNANIRQNRWTLVSAIFTVTSVSQILAFKNNSSEFNIDCFVYLDLSTTYGTDREPTRDWCDANIRFFENLALIPRAEDPEKVDTLDMSVLIDTPEIATENSIKAIEANIYTYKDADNESDICKVFRVINGTEEFTVKFSSLAKNCTITAVSVDANNEPTAVNTAVLVSYELYAQAAKVKVTANTDVRILVKGTAVSTQTSQYVQQNLVMQDSVLAAKTETIDNCLITNKMLAEDVVSYAMYWYNRGLTYDFDWRQNPAIEVLDYVQVYDDFNRNNTIMITERNIEYTDGVLGGSSKGVF